MDALRLYREELLNQHIYFDIGDRHTENKGGEKDTLFKDIINGELEKVNSKQLEADNLTQGFILGEVEDLHDVLIATEEARISLELAIQVRNKCIESFKEINNIQL